MQKKPMPLLIRQNKAGGPAPKNSSFIFIVLDVFGDAHKLSTGQLLYIFLTEEKQVEAEEGIPEQVWTEPHI